MSKARFNTRNQRKIALVPTRHPAKAGWSASNADITNFDRPCWNHEEYFPLPEKNARQRSIYRRAITDPYSLFELFRRDRVHGGIIKATIANYDKEWAASMILQLA
jgi:hypothetical protein